jgi:hypothetical protein
MQLSPISEIACHAANLTFFASWGAKCKRKQRILGLVAQCVSCVYFIDTELWSPLFWNVAFLVANTYQLANLIRNEGDESCQKTQS